MNKIKSHKIMSVFTLVMINVIAVDSLRSLPATAQFGYSVVFYYLMAGIFFFIPVALVAGELATTWPQTGGIYCWAKEAFGKNFAFCLVVLQWLYNVCWYPTILSLMAATFAYCTNPMLAQNKIYMFTTITIMFWMIIFINCFGLKVSNYFTTASSIFGIILPILFIIILGFIWYFSQRHSQISFTLENFLPNFKDINSLAFFTSVLFSLVGIEMSAIHAGDVKNPQKDYPRALFISSFIILSSFIFASLAIAIVVPADQLNVVTGLLEAYHLFFLNFHIQWLMPIVALLIVCGGAGGVSAWLLGPVKTLLLASQDGLIPKSLGKLNKHHAPYRLLLLQGGIFMILSSAFIFLPSVSSGFWLLSQLTSQLALIFYIALFFIAIALRYKYPNLKRPFRVPFGNFGMWVSCISGTMVCLLTIWFGFLPPTSLNITWSSNYQFVLIAGILISCSVPYIWVKSKELR